MVYLSVIKIVRMATIDEDLLHLAGEIAKLRPSVMLPLPHPSRIVARYLLDADLLQGRQDAAFIAARPDAFPRAADTSDIRGYTTWPAAVAPRFAHQVRPSNQSDRSGKRRAGRVPRPRPLSTFDEPGPPLAARFRYASAAAPVIWSASQSASQDCIGPPR